MPNNSTCLFNFDNTYESLPRIFYTRQNPIPCASPKIIIFNEQLAEQLGLRLSLPKTSEVAETLSGNRVPEGASPMALAYAGHQFGHFTMLGDGRAHLLGEHITPDGRRLDIQLKGSGLTPYSRRGDGRAALGPMLREYLISEAMHYLNIPTTRSLAVVATGETVYREDKLPGAVLTRVASSHIRVGTFEYLAAFHDDKALKMMADYLINRHYPDAIQHDNPYKALFCEVIKAQVFLITEWMRVGFIHGVMNTDNMALSGQTIDFGPCAFLDEYDQGKVFSSIDHESRYAFANQPHIGKWNLARLAETLMPLIDSNENNAIQFLEEQLEEFDRLYESAWLNMMRHKLGLREERDGDKSLINKLLTWMQHSQADYTETFSRLSQENSHKAAIYSDDQEFISWRNDWNNRQHEEIGNFQENISLMKKHNPVLIPRNHQVETALSAAAEGVLEPYLLLLDAIKTPYEENPKHTLYQKSPKPEERIMATFCGT